MTGDRLIGASAVITGGGRGIGAAIARAFAREGAAVVVAARTSSEVEAVAAEIASDLDVRVGAVTLDVTSDASVTALVAQSTEILGVPPNVLVNNAGIYRPQRFMDYKMQDWEDLLAVNLVGTVRVTRALLPAMLERGQGKVINMASTAAKTGTPNQSAYNASKHGLLGLTRCLALEIAALGVQVNAICPGWVSTDLITNATEDQAVLLGVTPDRVPESLVARIPIGRMTEPDEVASLAVYLASRESDAMTGVGLTLAGGMIQI